MVLINPVKLVYVPFEFDDRERGTKRNDLPRFTEPEQVKQFMKANPRIHKRNGKHVKLQWIGHDEAWAIEEYAREVGKWQS